MPRPFILPCIFPRAFTPSTGPGSVEPSYKPGVTWTDLAPSLPSYAITAIREAIPAFETFPVNMWLTFRGCDDWG